MKTFVVTLFAILAAAAMIAALLAAKLRVDTWTDVKNRYVAARSPEPDKVDEKESFDNLLQNIQSASVPADRPYAFPGDAKMEDPNADSDHGEIGAHACADSLGYSVASTRVQDDA